MNIPNEEDWRSEPWGIDTPCAYEHFFGKALEDAIRLFEEDSLTYQEDVMFMPSRVFGFYLRAYIAHLMSPAAKDDADGASCFISLIGHRAEFSPEDIEPLWSEIEPVLRRLAEHQDFFDADWVVYGSFRSRIRDIVDRGFTVTFDTSLPEVVPESIGLAEMAMFRRTDPVPMAVAAQVFANSGFPEMDSVGTRQELFAVCGLPDEAGGGEHPTIGHIPDWVRYDRAECSIRFEFRGEAISAVTFMQVGE